MKIEIIGLESIPLIKEGDDIAEIIADGIKQNDIILENNDIIVIAQTIISKSNGRIVNLKNIQPSKRSIELFKKMAPLSEKFGLQVKSPELIEVILNESKEILKAEHVMIVETNHGFVCANAGIDKSNIEGNDNVTLLPKNPDEDAEIIRKKLKILTNQDVGIIISDSFGRAFRVGAVGAAVGISGLQPIIDKRGSKDLFGFELQSTIVGLADNLASAAQLVMGEADEGIPVVLLKGYDFELNEQVSINPIIREKSSDLFRSVNIDYQLKTLKNRRSYKYSFDSKILEKEIIENCIEIARWAPSAHNGQFWRYIILEKGQIRNKLIDKMNTKLRSDLEADGKTEAFIRSKIMKTRNDFLESPFLILLCLDSTDLHKYPDKGRENNEYIMGVQSISASATYLLLTFEIFGLTACWYCAPLFAQDIVKSTLNLPGTYKPMAIFTVGYPIKPIKAPKRKKLNEIIYNVKI